MGGGGGGGGGVVVLALEFYLDFFVSAIYDYILTPAVKGGVRVT